MDLIPRKGFTLVELLITISIIAILSAIGLVVYSNVLKQGRDSKRQSDLRSIQSALEQYYSDQGFYPAGITFDSPLSADGKTYLNTIPNDPMGGSWTYAYIALTSGCDNSAANKCTSYCLYAYLENSNPGLPTACASYGSLNFAVTPP